MDTHDSVFYENTTVISRRPLIWPNGYRVAFAAVVSVEYYELRPPSNAFIPANVPGGFGRAPYPDVRAFSQREYGNRVGVFRVIEAFDKSGLSATAAVDAAVAQSYPYLVRQFRERRWPIVGHGYSLTRVISNKMSIDEEREYLNVSLTEVQKQSGARPTGWHGPEYGESERTPALLAELGIDYLLDWPNDEQPYVMRTPSGTILSLPMALELDDVVAHYHRRISMKRWKQAVLDALDQLTGDGRQSGRLLILNLHPWLIGHPHRIGYLEELLAEIASRNDVWKTTTQQLADHHRTLNSHAI
ncbi:polysaccharide deacetylase family protein [Bradyrhizobium sp. NP1]|uniref:polysaccharide deacetylase family protein n=1 Tax=Bradyrhizobium sp. NP1 TaxID=3049772 RepID=UPI0025A636DC|nr:polysaccharide deacetylase family protein [Bradyrhizobium sp. NP1]WJR75816.1 polysaccharide deacetylase family protein [Bradyrhizobium sp. NP1]